MKVSLCMIVRNCAEGALRALASAIPVVDELVIVDTGSTDDTKRRLTDFVGSLVATDGGSPPSLVMLDYKDPHDHPRWISNFAAARNVGWKAATGDMILWLDSDDTLVGGEEMRAFLEEHCDGPPSDLRIDSIEMRYDYQHDLSGACTLRQKRFRVVRRGHFEWEYPIHELMKPLRPGTVAGESYELPFWVRHHGADSHETRKASAERNLWVCEMWEQDGHDMNARMWSSKAQALRMLGRHEEALECASKCIAKSCDQEELYTMYVRRGDSYRALNRLDDAMDDYARAERVCPHFKLAYLAMAETMLEKKLYRQALVWCDKADMAGGDKEGNKFNPTAAENVPLFVRAMSCLALENYEDARVYAEKLYSKAPDNQILATLYSQAHGAVRAKRLFDSYQMLHDALEQTPERRENLRLAVPDELKVFPGFAEMHLPDVPEDKLFVAIYCHRTINVWGPGGLEKGVGGSEEAVIFMSRTLAARGCHVEVYGTPPVDEMGQDEHGVWWFPFHAWQADRNPDVFIGWRDTRYMTFGRDAKLRYLWLQDIPQSVWYTPELVESLDGILCISKLQASHLPDFAQKKVIVTGNGIDPAQAVNGENLSNRFIYCSSPDRGLEQLLERWGRIKEAIPDAELDVYYGFRDVYIAGMDRNSVWARLKEKIENLAKQPGVNWHGMVGVTELHKAMANTGFWLYPTSFEESYCTNAAKVQMMGCIPITSRYPGSSLPEVCGMWDLGPEPRKGLIKNDESWLSEWTERVIDVSQRADEYKAHRADMKAWAQQTLTWDGRADQWLKVFKGALSPSTSPSQEAVAAKAD